MSPTHTAGRIRRFTTKTLAVAGAGALLAGLVACDEDPGPGARDFIAGAEVVDQSTQVNVKAEQMGSGNANGPVANVTGEASVINGGSKLVTIASDQTFDAVRIAVQAIAGAIFVNEEDQPEPGQLPGYYEIELPAPTNQVDLVLTMVQQLPTDQFRFDYALVAGGEQGPITAQDAVTVQVGSGEVQVSVAWDTPSDVDLYVVDPNGEEIYWYQTTSSTGGQLDLDSNSDCNIDNTNNENITWELDAPPGTYTVRVNYWSSCGVDATSYVVTVRVGGQQPQIFNGEFSGDGEGGGAGAGDVVTTFTVTG